MQCWQILTSGRCVRPSRRDSLRPRVASTFGECLPIMSFNFTFHGLKYAGRNKFRLYTSVTKWIFLYFLLYHPQLIQVFAIYSSWQSFDLILYSYPITVKPMFSFLSPFGQKNTFAHGFVKNTASCEDWKLSLVVEHESESKKPWALAWNLAKGFTQGFWRSPKSPECLH